MSFVSQSKKVVDIEWLAARYRLRPAELVNRLETLRSSGLLTGVLDERGSFIALDQQELQAAASLIRSLGRVSIAELTRRLADVVHLVPSETTEPTETAESTEAHESPDSHDQSPESLVSPELTAHSLQPS